MKRLSLILILLLVAFGTQARQAGKSQVSSILSLSDDADGCFQDQTTSGAAALTLNGVLASGGKCKFASAQQISIEGTGTNSGVVAAIIGKGADGKDERENLTLVNAGTAKSVRYYIEIISINVNGAVDGNIEGGPLSTNGAVSKSLVPDLSGYDSVISLAVGVTGTLTYTIESTLSNTASSKEQLWFGVADLEALTANNKGNLVVPIAGIRARISSYTSGTLELTILQGRGQ